MAAEPYTQLPKEIEDAFIKASVPKLTMPYALTMV
jgi:hypothetical protein